MRASMLFVTLIACGGGNQPAAGPQSPSSGGSMLDCAKVGDHIATVFETSRRRAGTSPGKVKEMVTTRCESDAWTEETRQCLFAITSMREGRGCASGMTDEQRTALRTHARSLRSDAGTDDSDDPSTDWIRHVIED